MSASFLPTPFPSTGAPLPSGFGVNPAPVGARIVPTERQTAYGKPAVQLVERMHQDYPQRPVMIASPRLAPSAVSSEQALQARAMMTPEFQQNIMASRILRTSNLYAETPRFRNQLDILA
jgi:hypothetical protein